MRERLIGLLSKFEITCSNTCSGLEKSCYSCRLGQLAEFLLADGWIRPPCKVGTVVYFVARNSGKPIGTIDEIEIVQIAQRKEGFHAKGRFKGSLNEFEIRSFKIDNYSFFLTLEEAEAALVNYESSKIEKGGEEVRCSKWLLHADGSGTCKVCGKHQKHIWDMDNWQNFCGHCGARMDGGKAE